MTDFNYSLLHVKTLCNIKIYVRYVYFTQCTVNLYLHSLNLHCYRTMHSLVKSRDYTTKYTVQQGCPDLVGSRPSNLGLKTTKGPNSKF